MLIMAGYYYLERLLLDHIALTACSGVFSLLALSHGLEIKRQIIIVFSHVVVINHNAAIHLANLCRQ